MSEEMPKKMAEEHQICQKECRKKRQKICQKKLQKDGNCQLPTAVFRTAVFLAGPQTPVPDGSVPSTASDFIRESEDMLDRTPERVSVLELFYAFLSALNSIPYLWYLAWESLVAGLFHSLLNSTCLAQVHGKRVRCVSSAFESCVYINVWSLLT